jgi:hypothetical protein
MQKLIEKSTWSIIDAERIGEKKRNYEAELKTLDFTIRGVTIDSGSYINSVSPTLVTHL